MSIKVKTNYKNIHHFKSCMDGYKLHFRCFMDSSSQENIWHRLKQLYLYDLRQEHDKIDLHIKMGALQKLYHDHKIFLRRPCLLDLHHINFGIVLQNPLKLRDILKYNLYGHDAHNQNKNYRAEYEKLVATEYLEEINLFNQLIILQYFQQNFLIFDKINKVLVKHDIVNDEFLEVKILFDTRLNEMKINPLFSILEKDNFELTLPPGFIKVVHNVVDIGKVEFKLLWTVTSQSNPSPEIKLSNMLYINPKKWKIQ